MSLMTRNWIALHVVLGLFPLLFFLLVALAERRETWALFPSPNDTLISVTSFLARAPVSWILLLFLVVSGLASAALATGFWFSRREKVHKSLIARIGTSAVMLAAAAAVAALFYLFLMPRLRQDFQACIEPSDRSTACLVLLKTALAEFPLLAVTITLVLAVLAYVFFSLREKVISSYSRPSGQVPANPLDPREQEENVRSRMTRALASSNLIFGLVAALIIIDVLGSRLAMSAEQLSQSLLHVSGRLEEQNVYAALRVTWRRFWPFIIVLAPAVLTIWAHAALRRGSGPGWLSRPAGQSALGGSILFLWLVIWAAIARSIPWPMLPGAVGVIAIALVIELFCYGFLNTSSLVALYAARLKRAYVGASNPTQESQGFDIDRFGDHIDMPDYYGNPSKEDLRSYRPVHLINCTIAQTEPEGDSSVVAYDRKGKPLHVSPAGIVHQEGGPGLSGLRRFESAEQLTLSTWTAVSGAAASTAIGSLTSLGLSILAMMANVRLGYWWKTDPNSDIWPRSFPADTTLGYLFSELQGRFAPDERKRRRWYLTDGGHFENTGAYTLIQRRLDLIVVCDNGADPDYRLDDIVRLIDRARIDLNAEIAFFDQHELDGLLSSDAELRAAFGSYDELARPPARDAKGPNPYAALARIRYDIDREGEPAPVRGRSTGHTRNPHESRPAFGTLLLIKPRLNFSEPPELLAYQRRQAGRDFPQQTTLDQFFDEEQWEAYRRFGEVVGQRLFAHHRKGWSPCSCLEGTAPLPTAESGSGK